MARRAKETRKKATRKEKSRLGGTLSWLRRWTLRVLGGMLLLILLFVTAFSMVNPPTTPYIIKESARLDGVTREWVDMEQIAPVMARAAVAAEDADFCRHWGLDLSAIRGAIESGGDYGGSTISQQVVKNVYLWHGRSYTRKVIEVILTPMVEAIWSKRRIIEVYLNVAEFDEGVFGVQAAAQHYFNVDAADLNDRQAALLAALLPAPKTRSASAPSNYMRTRSAQIIDGAATIARDGRAACFEAATG